MLVSKQTYVENHHHQKKTKITMKIQFYLVLLLILLLLLMLQVFTFKSEFYKRLEIYDLLTNLLRQVFHL